MKKVVSIVLVTTILMSMIFSAVPVFAQKSRVMKVSVNGRIEYYTDFGEGWMMALEASEKYSTTITLLKDWYAGDENSNGIIDSGETPGYFKYYKDGKEYGTIDGALTTGHSGEDVPNMKLTLDLNGHTISRNLESPVEDGVVFSIQRKTFYIQDTSEAKTGKITGGNNTGNGGAFKLSGMSVVYIDGCEISGNSAKNGGGIYISQGIYGSRIFLNGTKITGNKAEVAGGGVYNGGIDKFYTYYNFAVGSDTVIWGNERFDGEADNLYLHYEPPYMAKVLQAMGQYNSSIAPLPLTEGARIGVHSNGEDIEISASESLFHMNSVKYFSSDDSRCYIRPVYKVTDDHNTYKLYLTTRTNSDVSRPNIRTVSVKNKELLKSASIDIENQVITLTAVNTKKNAFEYASLDNLISYTVSPDTKAIAGSEDVCNLLSTHEYKVMGNDDSYVLCTVQVVPEGGDWAEVQEEVENNYVISVNDGDRVRAFADFESGWVTAIKQSRNQKTTVTLLADWNAPDGKFYYKDDSGEYGTDKGRLHLNTGSIDLVIDLNGHTINRNLSSAVEHGQVFRIENGMLTIKDSSEAQTGTITGGNNAGDGGAFYMSNGSLLIEGGEISGNQCTGNGAGVYWYSDGVLCITDGTITGNTAGGKGGGVYVTDYGAVYLGGTPVLVGNKQANNVESNLFLADDVKIHHAAGMAWDVPKKPLTEGANIGITSVNVNKIISGDNGHFAQDSFAYMHADDEYTYYIRSVYVEDGGGNTHQLHYTPWGHENARYPRVKSVAVKNTEILESAELDYDKQYITLKAYKHKKDLFDYIALADLISCEYDKDIHYIYQMDVPCDLYSGFEYKIMSDNNTYVMCKINIEWVDCTHNDADGNCICDGCGEYTLSSSAVTDYNAQTKEATVFTTKPGKYLLIFADYENERLANVDIIEYDFKEGVNVIAQENANFVLGSGDMVMVWYDMLTLRSVCDALTIE